MSFKTFFEKTRILSKSEKRIEFRKYCKNYLEKSEGKKVYMYSEYVQKNNNLPKNNYSIDLIVENMDGSIQIVLCKFRKNIIKQISEKDLETTFVFAEKNKKYITYPIIIMSTSIEHDILFDDMNDVKFYHWDSFGSIFDTPEDINDAQTFNGLYRHPLSFIEPASDVEYTPDIVEPVKNKWNSKNKWNNKNEWNENKWYNKNKWSYPKK